MQYASLSVLATAALTLATALPAAAESSAHASVKWTGPGTCVSCHAKEAQEVHGSAHYQWQGQAPYSPGPLLQGKLKTAFNSYCINITGNWGSCGNCHVGQGAKPTTVADTQQLNNIDCLICHQEKYKRKKVNGLFVPDTAAMTITMDQAVQTVHKPNRATCLQCHAKGGGGDNYKRGDLALAHTATTDRAFDVHMATTGANLACQRCHRVSQHRIAGRGSDLRETDLNVSMNCSTSTCHAGKTSASSGHSSSTISRHVYRVACQTCHVGAASARNAADTPATEATEIFRDWAQPHLTSSGAIHPTPTMVNNIKPVYRFWNKYSQNYSLGDQAFLDPVTGAYPTSRPQGAITDTSTATKLYPFKYKTASQPFAPRVQQLIALDTSIYFASGDLVAATAQGLVNMGLPATEPWQMVKSDTMQLLTHEIAPKASALTCSNCHGSTATQMNLRAIGYVLKGSASSVCVQCHEYKSPSEKSFQELHHKHVDDKRIECSMCHSFARPERQLLVGIVRD